MNITMTYNNLSSRRDRTFPDSHTTDLILNNEHCSNLQQWITLINAETIAYSVAQCSTELSTGKGSRVAVVSESSSRLHVLQHCSVTLGNWWCWSAITNQVSCGVSDQRTDVRTNQLISLLNQVNLFPPIDTADK